MCAIQIHIIAPSTAQAVWECGVQCHMKTRVGPGNTGTCRFWTAT